MDKMMEEFEIFMANPHWSWATGDMKEELYCLWKASRSALCVDIPPGIGEKQFMNITSQFVSCGIDWT